MSEKPLLPVYLLTGGDRPKIRVALSRLRGRFESEGAQVLSAETTSGSDVVAELNALGLFGGGGGRLIIVEGVERWTADDAQALVAYLTEPVPGAVLALVAGEPLKASKLPALVAKGGQVLAYEAPKTRDLPAWVRARFEELGATADGEAARALVEIVGDDVTALASEADKIAAWASGEPIGRREVEILAVPAQEASAWAVTDAWGARDLPRALNACQEDLEHGQEPFLVAVRLAAQVALVQAARALSDEGLNVRDSAKRLRKHEFRVRKALVHADKYSRDELQAAMVRLAELDAALKGASRLAGDLELELALIELMREPEPALRA
jgi:DNA polymerase III subunit delta